MKVVGAPQRAIY